MVSSRQLSAASPSVSGVVVKIEDCQSGTLGSNLPRHLDIFSIKIEETCTLTTFVEQKLSLCVKKLGNFMRVYVNRERAV